MTNRYQEALDRVYCTLESIDRRKAYNTLYELVKKEHPKKPLDVKYDNELNELSWECPNCHTCYPYEKDRQDRCDVCGQVLDWSNDE